MKLLGLVLVFSLQGLVAFAQPLNAVIGDASWVARYGSEPGGDAGETKRIRTHLAYVEAMLRAVDASHLDAGRRGRRAQALDALAEYRARGLFPRRTDDVYAGRRPRFIDDRGVHCAVGALIAMTGFPELAQQIRDEYEYAYVPDIHDPDLLAWADQYGFSVRELATIQPGYSAPPTAASTRARIEEMKDTITIACAREHEPPSSFRLRVRGDSHGNAHPTARSSDPFVQCFMSKLGDLGAGGAWDQQPSRYRLRMRVRITSPQELLQRRLRALRVDGQSTSCVPRPGPTPDRAFFNVRIDERGARVGVRTHPRNREVDRCLRRWMLERLSDFGAGRWSLHGRAPDLPLGRVMSAERLAQAVASYAPHLGTECFEHGAPEHARVRVRASVGEPFDIAVEGGEVAWRECLRERLDERLRSNFSVPRQLEDGSYERLFLVDAAAEAEHSFDLETPAAREQRTQRERERMEREMENQYSR